MKKYFWTLNYLWALLAMPLAASTSRIWVANYDSRNYAIDRDTNYANDRINLIDPVTNKIVQTIRGVPKPGNVVFSPDGSRGYVGSVTSEHNLFVLDMKTGKIIKKVLLSGRPNRPAISKDGKRLFVAIRDPGPAVPIADAPDQDFNFDNKKLRARNGGAVDIVDADSLKLVKTIPTTGPMHNCYVTPDGKYVACDSPEGHNVVVINAQTEQIAWQTDVHGPERQAQLFRHGDPQSMSVEAGPDGSTSRITVEIRGLRGFAVVDFAKHKQVDVVQFPDQPSGFLSSGNEPHTHGDTLSPDGKTRWVSSNDGNAIFVYSLPELKLLGHVTLPEFDASGHPELTGHPAIGCTTTALTFTPDGNRVYATCSPGFGIPPFVFATDTKTLKVVARIPVEGKPQDVNTLVLP